MNLRLGVILTIVLAGVVLRLATSAIPNFSPVTAIALFSGAYLIDKRMALLIPMVSMLIGDLILGLHNTMFFVYGAFALITLMGSWLRGRVCGQLVIAASLISSVIFFLLTNFGVWLLGGYYPMTMEGLIACYIAAIPFFQMTLLGDLFFAAIFFGLFMVLEYRLPALRKDSGISA